MQYKCMERQSRNLSMEGFHFPFCYAHREYSGRNAALAEGNKESLYTDFLLPLSGSPGAWKAKRILQIRKKYDNQSQKHGYHPLQHEPVFPDDKSRVGAGFSCDLALREARHTDWLGYHPCFCAAF